MELPDTPPECKSERNKIGEKTVFSLYFVIIVVTVAVWIVRLSDRVESQDRIIAELREQIKDLSNRLSTMENGRTHHEFDNR